MAVTQTGDPRLETLFGAGSRDIGVRPVVRLRRSGPSELVIVVVAGLAAVLLFWALMPGRNTQPQPPLGESASSTRQFAPEAPPLHIPPAPPVEGPSYYPQTAITMPPPVTAPSPVRQQRPVVGPLSPPTVYPLQPQQLPQPQMTPPLPVMPARTAGGATLVVDMTARAAQSVAAAAAGAAPPFSGPRGGGRVRATALANHADTVTQGVLIPAVLETAFDSTRGGFARAIVSRDVRGFDGTRVLIPRGSRLVGEYQAEVAFGQKRALINWTRLVRPDGMMIAIDSPATDTLGRGGVRAAVNNHFVERFLGALLRTTVDIGAAVATRAVRGPVFVALPGSTSNLAQAAPSDRISPTLSIHAGTSISIFVARDLEFAQRGSR